MRRIHRRRVKRTLAVSTVIANMMMITITLGLAAILIAWTGSTYGLFAGGAQIFYQQRGQALQERFVVENVFFDNAQNIAFQCPPLNGVSLCVLMWVRNVGAEQINLAAIYVNGTCLPSTGLYGTYEVNGCNPPLVQDQIPVCATDTVCVHEYMVNIGTLFSSTSPARTGSILYIVVASSRGNRVTYMVRMYVPGT